MKEGFEMKTEKIHLRVENKSFFVELNESQIKLLEFLEAEIEDYNILEYNTIEFTEIV